MPQAQREKAIERVTRDTTAAFGPRLVCLVLYGSAVGESFDPRASDVNFAIVLDRISHSDLKRFHDWLPAWHRLGIATPLLIDREFLTRARDVFPLELEDIRVTHRLLAGDDVFAAIEVVPDDLRRQLEQEARGKLLRLRVAYAESGGRRKDVETLMVESVKSFVIIMRGVLRLRNASAPVAAEAVIAEFERVSGSTFAVMLDMVKARNESTTGGVDAAERFDRYLAEVEHLVEQVDQLYDATAADVGAG